MQGSKGKIKFINYSSKDITDDFVLGSTMSDEDKAMEGKLCPKAPTLKPRNCGFKFNSTKVIDYSEDLIAYNPFFMSEGEDSSEASSEGHKDKVLQKLIDLKINKD